VSWIKWPKLHKRPLAVYESNQSFIHHRNKKEEKKKLCVLSEKNINFVPFLMERSGSLKKLSSMAVFRRPMCFSSDSSFFYFINFYFFQ